MTDWLSLAPVEEWERTEESHHRITFEHSGTGERIIAFRLRGPGTQTGGDRVDYVLRHLPSEGEMLWREVATVGDISRFEQLCQETMQQLSG